MKELCSLLVIAAAGIAWLGFAASSASAAAIDTSTLQKAFQGASSVDKTEVQHVVSAIQAHDYPGAMSSLSKLASSGNLTPEQKNAVKDTANQVKANELGGSLTNQAGQGADKAAQEWNKGFKP